MTTAYTSLLGLALPVTGELSGTWGDTVNTAITSLLDTAIAGTTSITTDADITLSTTTGASNQARQAIILWNPASGTTTRNITAPAQSKMYTVINASGGTQSIVIRGAGPTTGVTVLKGESALVAWNGSDFVKVSSVGGTGTFTNLTVTGNTILGDASADTVTVNGTITSNLIFTDNTYDIGASGATRPRDLFLSRNLVVGGTLTLAGGVNLNGNVTIGDSSADTLTVNSTITSNLIFTDNTYDIGASGATRPRTLYLGTSLITPSITNSGLTSGRITFASAGGLLADSANLNFDGTSLGLGSGLPSSGIASASFAGLQVRSATSAALWGSDYATNLTTNAYPTTIGSVFTRGGNSYAPVKYSQFNGVHTWSYAAAAGTTISWTDLMTLDSSGLAVTGVVSATGVVSGQNFSSSNAGFSVGPATDSFQTGLQIFGSGGGGSAYKVITLANNVAVATATSTGFAVNGTLSASGNLTSPTLQLGTNPAGVSIGVLGIPNQKRIYGRNAANNADVNIAYVDGSNGLVFGPGDAATIDSSSNLSVQGFQFKLGTSGNSQVTILRGARPSVGSAGLQLFAGSSTTVNDAAPAAYITLGSGPLGDTYEGGLSYHAYGNSTGSGFQNAHTWYRRTGVDTSSQTMQISPTGVLDIGTGAGAVGQIKFPATQVATSEANTLDDYEEGTWTPAFSSTGASFTYPRGQYGTYVKIGSLVYAQFYIGADATGTTSNQCVISGLPFNSGNLNALAQAGATAWVSATTPLGFTKNNNDAIISVWQQNVGSASTASASQMSGGYLVGNCMYRAT
jgi:hypothetical protein